MLKDKKCRDLHFQKIMNGKKQFEDEFPYKETDDQLRCIEEGKKRYGTAKTNG